MNIFPNELNIQFIFNGHQANLYLSHSPHPITNEPQFYAAFFAFINGQNGIISTNTPFLPCQFERIAGDVLSFTTNEEFEDFLDLLYQCYLNDVMDVFYERYVNSVRLIKNANY